MKAEEIDQLKRLMIVALFSDDQLLGTLVLKGGNALSVVHGMTSRASFDLDFSMEGDFHSPDLDSISQRIEHRFKQAFAPVGYHIFDVRLEPN